jgi:hypothetical protein
MILTYLNNENSHSSSAGMRRGICEPPNSDRFSARVVPAFVRVLFLSIHGNCDQLTRRASIIMVALKLRVMIADVDAEQTGQIPEMWCNLMKHSKSTKNQDRKSLLKSFHKDAIEINMFLSCCAKRELPNIVLIEWIWNIDWLFQDSHPISVSLRNYHSDGPTF